MEKEPLITILSVNYNTSDYLKLMVEAFKKLTVNSYRMIVCDNGSNSQHLKLLDDIDKNHCEVEVIYRQQSEAGSVGHGEAMDLLVDKVRSPYFVTMDADATFLHKNWDEILLPYIDEQVKCIGTGPVKTSNKPTDFPLVYAVLFETKTYKKLGCSFLPNKEMITKGMDTGYIIRKNYLENNFSGVVFKDVNTREIKDSAFGDILCTEYYLEGYENIFACHFSRGSSDGVAKYKGQFLYRIPVLSKVIKKILGKRDRKRWIRRCEEILA